MIYNSKNEWLDARNRRILLFGMSGVGKTYISNMLRKTGGWFHYSVDYRIGTRYMGEHIVDNFKREAMNNEFLAKLLLSDSIYIGSNITFENLAPLSTFLGKPGNGDLGGIELNEYRRRQDLHEKAEIAALKDTVHFIARSEELYKYKNFVCDSGGSICEVVNPEDPDDQTMNLLSRNLLLVWIRGSESHSEKLIERFNRLPKPMFYRKDFFEKHWNEYCSRKDVREEDVVPDDFIRWIFSKAASHRHPRYEAMARNWGIVIDARDAQSVKDDEEFNQLVASALPG